MIRYTLIHKRWECLLWCQALCVQKENQADLASALKKPAFSEGTVKQHSRPAAQTGFRGHRQEGTASLTSEG